MLCSALHSQILSHFTRLEGKGKITRYNDYNDIIYNKYFHVMIVFIIQLLKLEQRESVDCPIKACLYIPLLPNKSFANKNKLTLQVDYWKILLRNRTRYITNILYIMYIQGGPLNKVYLYFALFEVVSPFKSIKFTGN